MDFAMEISVSDALGTSALNANDGPHRRATVDARPPRPKPGILLRRPSLPLRNKSVRFAPLSNVWEYPPSPEWMTWHKPRDQERFRVAAARELARGRGRFHEVHSASVE